MDIVLKISCKISLMMCTKNGLYERSHRESFYNKMILGIVLYYRVRLGNTEFETTRDIATVVVMQT